jgi:hypothetical protein
MEGISGRITDGSAAGCRRFALACALATVAAALAPAASHAATMVISPPALSAKSEMKIPATVTRTESIIPGYYLDGILYGLVAVSGSAPCPQSEPIYPAPAASDSELLPVLAEGPGPFALTYKLTFTAPGPYMLCGYARFGKFAGSLPVEVAPSERETEEKAPATSLSITVRSHHGGSYANPGHTSFAISGTPGAQITFSANHNVHSHEWRQPLELAKSGEEEEFNFEEEEEPQRIKHFEVRWSCRHPNLTVQYFVAAVGGSGPYLERTGHFHESLSPRWCHTARLREEAANARRFAAEIRAQERHEQGEAEAQRRRISRFEENCRKIGGTPVEISTSRGPEIVCHSKNGGIIPVPT